MRLPYPTPLYHADQLQSCDQDLLIAVPTIARGDDLKRVALHLANFHSDALILTSDGFPEQFTLEHGNTITVRPFTSKEVSASRVKFSSLSSGLPGERNNWDLPDKRNSAISYAREAGYSLLLLLDDDIGGLSHADVRAGCEITRSVPIFGILTGYFPDDSVVGHASSFIGHRGDRFVSGNCLFVNLDSKLGHFAGIYNEDWLFALSSDVSRIGTFEAKLVTQRKHLKWLSAEEAQWQEPGEFITSSIVELVMSGDADSVFDRVFWKAAKIEREQFLEKLRVSLGAVHEITSVVDAAANSLSSLKIDQILRFMEKFAVDSFASRAASR